MTTQIEFDNRFRGFEKIAHGGYVSGVLAQSVGGEAQVRLRRPIPMQRPLRVNKLDDHTVELRDTAGDLIAEAKATSLDLDLPKPVTAEDAEAASDAYPGHKAHLFPGCFCCGPGRASGDGLRIFPGALRGSDHVAALWVPNANDANDEGVIRPEIVWASFDCPQIWALILNTPPDAEERVVTGALETRLLGPVIAGERHVIVAWPIGREGRRLFAGAALFASDGKPLGLSRQTLIATASGVPLGLNAFLGAAR
ncbi:MAG: hotdog fold domain-containing protein [Polyangiales bacterium]